MPKRLTTVLASPILTLAGHLELRCKAPYRRTIPLPCSPAGPSKFIGKGDFRLSLSDPGKIYLMNREDNNEVQTVQEYKKIYTWYNKITSNQLSLGGT